MFKYVQLGRGLTIPKSSLDSGQLMDCPKVKPLDSNHIEPQTSYPGRSEEKCTLTK